MNANATISVETRTAKSVVCNAMSTIAENFAVDTGMLAALPCASHRMSVMSALVVENAKQTERTIRQIKQMPWPDAAVLKPEAPFRFGGKS